MTYISGSEVYFIWWGKILKLITTIVYTVWAKILKFYRKNKIWQYVKKVYIVPTYLMLKKIFVRIKK